MVERVQQEVKFVPAVNLAVNSLMDAFLKLETLVLS